MQLWWITPASSIFCESTYLLVDVWRNLSVPLTYWGGVLCWKLMEYGVSLTKVMVNY